MTICAQHTSARATERPYMAFTNHLPDQDTSVTRTVVDSNIGNFNIEEGPSHVTTPEIPIFEAMAASKARARGDDDVTWDVDAWVVSGAGRFTNRAVYTFNGDTLPAGLTKSGYTVQCREVTPPSRIPHNKVFDSANVQLSGGFLNLVVPGGQQPSSDNNHAVNSAEIVTAEQNILHGSVRTTAIFSEEPGTCHGQCPPHFLSR